jgi:hypothetical protein
MLVAYDDRDRRIVADDAERGKPYYCPECEESLILKHGEVVIPHFAHFPDVDCAWGVGESMRHMEMKHCLGELLRTRQFEVQAIPGRRADIALPNRIAVECQESAIGLAEWSARTKDYNARDWAVLWVWDSKRLVGYETIEGTDDGTEFRISEEIRVCHRANYGRVYVLDGDGLLRACHFTAVKRQNDWSEGPAEYRLKATRTVEYHITKLYPQRFTGSNGMQFANLGEGVWW